MHTLAFFLSIAALYAVCIAIPFHYLCKALDRYQARVARPSPVTRKRADFSAR